MNENDENKQLLIDNDSLNFVYKEYNDEDYYKAIIEEREKDIIETAENVNKINIIFSDLGKLVSEQQENVNDIENQINDAHSNTQNGVYQLERAEKTQRKLNKCYCYLLIVGLFILLITFIVLKIN
jgi:t-SNARE complex subunit (syntaxin)